MRLLLKMASDPQPPDKLRDWCLGEGSGASQGWEWEGGVFKLT